MLFLLYNPTCEYADCLHSGIGIPLQRRDLVGCSMANILSGPTSATDVDQVQDVLSSYRGELFEVSIVGEQPFAGTLTDIEPVVTDDMHESKVGLKLTVEKRKIGGSVTFSTSFRDDDMDDSSYIREF